MRSLCYAILLFWLHTLLLGCSPINSLQVFDDCQAYILVTNSSTLKPAREMVILRLPSREQWRKIIKPANLPDVQTLLVRGNENNIFWHESIQTKAKSHYNYPMTLNAFVKDEISLAALTCRGQGKILAQTSSYIVYKLECDRRIEIGKAWNGIDAFYLLKYVIYQKVISQVDIEKISRVIEGAELRFIPRTRY
jgi:hypothetical protein